MKKILGIFFAMILLCSSAFAAEIDYSSMSVDDLQKVIDTARNEVLKKTAQSNGNVFIIDDSKGISMYLTGKNGKNFMDYLELEVVVINNTSKTLTVSFNSITVNGWEVNTMMSTVSDVGPGKKKKDSISFDPSEADISSVNEITEMELTFRTYDSSTWKDENVYGPITIFYDGANWSIK